MLQLKNTYLVAAIGEWNRDLFNIKSTVLEGDWSYVSTPRELEKYLSVNDPQYIFFPHWRWIVSPHIVNKYNCVCFHMTDLPYGRGGSPLQNLIQLGHKTTVLSALKMDKGTDSGPIYFKEQLSLEGSAEQIYCRSAELAWDMIIRLIKEKPMSTPQIGDVTTFKRRTPAESELPHFDELSKLYDFIRMLDAPTYPRAFLKSNGLKFVFSNVDWNKGSLIAEVQINIDHVED